MQLYIWQEGRGEEGETLGVVVMEMAEQQDNFSSLPASQLAAQRDQACSRVQHDRPLPESKLHAGCVAPITDSPRSRRGITPAYTPEFNSQIIRHSAPRP